MLRLFYDSAPLLAFTFTSGFDSSEMTYILSRGSFFNKSSLAGNTFIIYVRVISYY